MSKAEFTFGSHFQEDMLALMMTDLSFTEKAIRFVPEERLFSEAYVFLFNQIKDKFERNGTAPSISEIEDRIKFVERHKRRVFKAFAEKIADMKVKDPEFIKEKLTEYARRSMFIQLFQDGQTLWNAKKHQDAYTYVMEGINALYGISFDDDVAIGIEDFEHIRQIYLKQNLLRGTRMPTGISSLDHILNGGLEKGELGVLLAEPKRGKSIGLVHMGCASLLTGSGRVAHFVLEGTTEQTVMRYQSRLTGIEYNRLMKDEITEAEGVLIDKVSKKYLERLMLVPMNKHWNYTVLDVEAKITELERRGLSPDLVVVDYADLLKSHEKADSLRVEQTYVYRYLKQVAMMKRKAIWTAAQAQRPKDDAEKITLLRAKDIAECYEKVRIADLVATLNQTPREKQIGILRLYVDIFRSNEAGKTIVLPVDFRRMIFHKSIYPEVKALPDWFFTNRKLKKK